MSDSASVTSLDRKWLPGDVAAPPRLEAARPRRRLIFINRYFLPDLSATSQLLTDLVGRLGADDYEIHVLCSRQLYADARASLPRLERVAGATVHRCWSTRNGRGGLAGRALDYFTFFLSAVARLLILARTGDIVVVLTDPPMMSVPVASVACLKGARLINWLQDVFPEVAVALHAMPLPPFVNVCLRRLRNWTLHIAARNVVIGVSMRRLVRAGGVSAPKVAVIENWADAESVRPCPPERSRLRCAIAAQRQFVIEYSGNLGRAHDYETLLGAALELRHESNWLFLFIGDGIKMQLLRNQAAVLGLDNMRFLPLQPRDALSDTLAAADVHVASLLPSLEGLIVPSKLYGIMAAGRPVVMIGDPDGEQARLVRGAHCGSVIAPGDSAGLVDELRRMRSDPEWLQHAGSNARALFERRYTLSAAVAKWRRVLESV